MMRHKVLCLAMWLVCFGFSMTASIRPARAQAQTQVLTLTITPTTFSETAGFNAARGTVSRIVAGPVDLAQPLTVQLSSSDTSEVTVPASVTILANNTSVSFDIAAVDDEILDFPQAVSITATSSGLAPVASGLIVEDDEAQISLRIVPDAINEDDGVEAALGTITRTQLAAEREETFSLFSSDPNALFVPTSVVIPAGQTSATFPVSAINNDIFAGERQISITATRFGFTSGQVTVQVALIDDEARLTLTLTQSTLSEAAGSNAATLTIERPSAASKTPLAIALESSDTSEATVPVYLLMAADQSSATVRVAAVDDLLVDGTQEVALSAEAQGFSRASIRVQVSDNDSPKLALRVNSTAIAEGAFPVTGSATITRNTPINVPLTVNLRVSDTTQAAVPTSVTIPAGAVSIDVPLRAVDDTLRDGAKRVTLTISQTGFAGSSGAFDVLDNDGDSLVVQLGATRLREVTDGGTLRATVVRTSANIAVPLVVALRSSDPLVATVPASVTIPAGARRIPFDIAISDNAVPEDIRFATIIASKAGFNPGASTLTVLDNADAAILTFSVQPAEFSETIGTYASTATITRNTATTSDIVVIVESSLPEAARVPIEVIIPVGASSATFIISAVDDLIGCNDPEDATITGRVAGFTSATTVVRVLNNEPCFGRGLSTFVELTGGVENAGLNAGTILVTRIDDRPDLDLVVDLISSDPARAQASAAGVPI